MTAFRRIYRLDHYRRAPRGDPVVAVVAAILLVVCGFVLGQMVGCAVPGGLGKCAAPLCGGPFDPKSCVGLSATSIPDPPRDGGPDAH